MDELEVLKNLLKTVISLVQQLQSEGEELSDEENQAVTEYIVLLTQAIAQRNQVSGPTSPQPPLEPAMPSSNVEGFAYNPENNSLYVRFLGQHPNRNGPVYQYNDVPPNIFNLFRTGAIPARTNGKNRWGSWWKGKTPSIGASLYTLIKNQGYDYRRVA